MRPTPILPPPVAPRRKRRRRSWLLSLLGFGFASAVVLFVAASGVAGFFVWKASRDLPDYDSLSKYEPPVMTRIHAHDGSLMAEYARERRIFVPINVVPKLVIAAFLSAEDKRFYEHGGLDFTGIVRAIVNNLQNYGKKRPEGASTITQQVAKNFLLSSEQKFERKLKEAILAIRIERAYPKNRILELYLNEIYLGMGSYGVAAAALNYFSKELGQLTIEEAAYLAALPKAPNNYHPFRRAREATIRRDWIIDQMADIGAISVADARAAKATPFKVNIRPLGTQIYAADYFAEDVRRTLVTYFGEDGLYGRAERAAVGDGRVNGGLSVRTTLDPNLQRLARKALIDGLVDFDREKGWRGPVQKIDIGGDWGAALTGIEVPGDLAPWRLGVVLEAQRTKAVVGLRPARQVDGSLAADREAVEIPFEEVRWARSGRAAPKAVPDVLAAGDVIWVAPKDPAKPTGIWSLMQVPEVGGGLVAMDPHTGRVHAVVGGFSFATSQFDRALQAKRQPGSSFKPLVYSAALDNGYKPTSIVLDAPDRDRPGPRQGSVAAQELRRHVLVRSLDVAARHREVAQSDDGAAGAGHGHAADRRVLEALRRLRRPAPRARHVAGRRRDHAVAHVRGLRSAGQRRQAGAAHPDRPHPGPLGPPALAPRQARMQGLQGREVGRAARADAGRRPPADRRSAHRLPDDLHDGRGGPARHRHRHQADPSQRTGRRQDRHHQRREGCLVHRLHSGLGGGRLHRLRLAEAPGQRHDRRPRRRSRVRQLLEDGAGRQEGRAVPQPPGIKQVRVSLRTGLRATGGEGDTTVLESFKPYEEPDDAYSIVGFTDERGGFFTGDQSDAPRGVTSGRGVY